MRDLQKGIKEAVDKARDDRVVVTRITNLRRDAERVVKFYNGRGVAEQWIKEGKNAVKWTKLSCHDFVDNQVRPQLFALAYNLGNFLRRAALPPGVSHWSLTTLHGKSSRSARKSSAPSGAGSTGSRTWLCELS